MIECNCVCGICLLKCCISGQYICQCVGSNLVPCRVVMLRRFCKSDSTRVGVKYSTCTWYLYLSTYLSVLDVLEYLVYGNVKVLVLVLVLDQQVLGTYK